jgi:hypothetical protein
VKKQRDRSGGKGGEQEKEKGHSPREQSLSKEGIPARAFALADVFFQMKEELAERVLVRERIDPERREGKKKEKFARIKQKVSRKMTKKERQKFCSSLTVVVPLRTALPPPPGTSSLAASSFPIARSHAVP